MALLAEQKKRRLRKIQRVRKRVFGTQERPRVSFTQTNRYIYVQAVNDLEGKTLSFLSSQDKEITVKGFNKKNSKTAELLAEKFSEKLKKAKIEKIVLDRREKKFHGVIKTFAAKLREKGIQF